MADEAPAAPSGALTIDQAVAEMTPAAAPTPEPAAEAPAPQPAEDTQATPTAGDDATPPEGAVSGEGETEVVEPASGPVIEPPANWDADAKARFAELPSELQEYLKTRASESDRAVSTAQREAATVRTETEARMAEVKTLATQLETFVPEAIRAFRADYGLNPDWDAVADQYGADEAIRLRSDHDRKQQLLGELIRHEANAKAIVKAEFVKAETARLAEIRPELAAPEARAELGKYLLANGVTRDELNEAGAGPLAIAWKAMQWDKLQSATKIPARPATPPVPQVRPGASVPSSPNATIATASRRLSQTGKVDDAVALLNARKGGKG